ncbi:MAG: hypothetical protein KDN22_01510 [Verrucomicrobiae bacterium]|nr:hypothetical protein [Verrucomicrobiae bacterium]
MSSKAIVLASALLALAAASGHAVEILGTDFAGRTIDFDVASSIVWRASGIVSPGDLTVVDPDVTGLLAGLFDTDDTLEAFVPDLNIHNEGRWRVDIPIEILDASVTLLQVDIGLGIYNNSGALQFTNRDADVTVTILDDGGNEIGTAEGFDTFPNEGDVLENPALLSIPLAPVTLAALGEYTLRLDVSGEGPGNNAGFDSISVQGTVGDGVPDPVLIPATRSVSLGRLPAFPLQTEFTVSLTNGGQNEQLQITAVEVAGESADSFTVGAFPAAIASGEAGEIKVVFDSKGESADFRAELIITSNSALGDEVVIELSALIDAPGGDSDGDGLTDGEEVTATTDPFVADSDGDGLSDGDEVKTHLTNPTLADSDEDGFPDGAELEAGTDPTDPASSPARLLFTDFQDRTINGLVASGFVWAVDGIESPGSLTAVDTDDTGILVELFDTDAAQNAFVPDMNIHNEGPWHVDVPLTVTAASILISRAELGIGIFSNGGVLQGVSRDVDIEIVILQEEAEVATGEALDIFAGDGPFETNPGMASVLFGDGQPLSLPAGIYTMRIRISGEGPGNNAGIASIAIEGRTGGNSRGLEATGIDLIASEEGAQVLEIEWQSVPGGSYSVDSSIDLNVWREEQDGIPSDGTRTTFHMDGPFDPFRFYRIRRE